MADYRLITDAIKKENKELIRAEILNTGNVLADEQKLIRSERKSMEALLENLERLKGRVPHDEYLKLINEYYSIDSSLRKREEAYFELYHQNGKKKKVDL